jgi:hypothetical protein
VFAWLGPEFIALAMMGLFLAEGKVKCHMRLVEKGVAESASLFGCRGAMKVLIC